MSTTHRPLKRAELLERNGGVLPPLAGGAPDSPIPYPLEPVSVNGTLVTMDQYVNNPTEITRLVATVAAQKFYAHTIFTNGGGVEGGAILFERPNPLLTDLYAARRTQEMAPGTQAPILTFARGVPMVATPREIGGKFPLTKQERKRNNPVLVENAITQVGNTIARDLEIMALSELNAVIAATNRTFAFGSSFVTAAGQTYNNRSAANQPANEFARLIATVENEERATSLNSAIFNTLDWAQLTSIYSFGGADGNTGARAMLAANGITNVYATPRQPQGRIKLYEAGQVGTWNNEFPLETITWIDEEEDQKFWSQTTVSPTFAVTNQFKMIEATGV